MTDPRCARFQELLECPRDLTDAEWLELGSLSRQLDCEDQLDDVVLELIGQLQELRVH